MLSIHNDALVHIRPIMSTFSSAKQHQGHCIVTLIIDYFISYFNKWKD